MADVFNTYSRIKIPYNDARAFIHDSVELPPEIKALNITENSAQSRVTIESEPVDDSISRYTPTAELKGGLSDEEIAVNEDGELTHQTPREYQQDTGWRGMEQDEEEVEIEEIRYLNLYGQGDDVIVHDKHRRAMFDILCQLTTAAISGHVRAVVLEDGELTPVWYEAGGEQLDVTLSIVEPNDQHGAEGTSNESGSDSDEAQQWTQF